MQDPILVVNAGSSSIKFSVFETRADRSLAAKLEGQVERIGNGPRLEAADSVGNRLASRAVERDGHDGAIAAILAWFEAHVGSERAIDGVGHRIVHGGPDFAAPVRIDSEVLARLEALVPLAPLHQPHNIAAVRAIAAAAPDAAQVACFDTAFHHGQLPVAQAFALPREITAKGIRRYGFHGLSYEYIAGALPPECADGKVVAAHLGNGASLCAIARGRSIATTMGLTALDGLMMGTRPGALDPGVLLYLMQHERMDAAALENLLYHRGGLLGVSGISSDMRTLLESGDASAREAIDLFVYRIGREIGSLAAALGGLDALVFTGGIGEHAAPIRARVCRDAEWLGIRLDEAANEAGGPRISLPVSRVSAWVIPTDENLMIARHTRRLLDQARGSSTAAP
ncbi:MAG TPA: acetate/propionate family kinase [Stellaceae bacterium]|nr:acetate/propionate family kinase [Stellaceae bacterium]